MALTTVNSGGIEDDSIVNADIKSDAAIDLTKLNSGSLPTGIAVNQQNIAAGQLVTGHIAAGTGFQISNSNVSDSAAIALSKLASTPAVLTGSTNNTIATVTGANAIQGEANLTYDGSTLGITRGDSGTLDAVKITNSDTTNNGLVVGVNSSEEAFLWNGSNSSMNFATNNAERVRIDEFGRVLIGTTTVGAGGADELTVNTASGHGGMTIRTASDSNGNIWFSDGTSGAAEYTGWLQYSHASNNLNIGVNSVEKIRIHTDGTTSFASGIGLGNALTYAASNTLDDYEEGTWTPSFNNAYSSVTYSSQQGIYVKIGRMVHCSFIIAVTAATAEGPGIRITGLPFTTHANNYSSGGITYCDLFSGFEKADPYIAGNTTEIRFYQKGSATQIATSGTSNITSEKYLGIGFTYQV